MRLHFALLLAVVITLATTTGVATVAGLNTVIEPSPRKSAPLNRVLRTVGDEERVSLRIPSLKRLIYKSSSQKQLDQLVKSGVSTDDAFIALKLDDVQGMILSNPKFKVWEKYVTKVNKPNREAVIFMKLHAKYGDAELAMMLHQATKVTGTAKTANKLQTAQFEQWDRAGRWPADILDDFFKIPDAKFMSLHISDPRRQVRSSYAAYWYEKHPNWLATMSKP
ncbi:unnamed protein product [Phytophthora fragariaefolia]|uniref:Unnamed protein product n=1 Tax=Phytophthora fragariaefolia TaxID=1490495 RepID=A0A9W7D2G2_9STRA|nr:unnamed protein product [Phytophthora fragariaefolia]